MCDYYCLLTQYYGNILCHKLTQTGRFVFLFGKGDLIRGVKGLVCTVRCRLRGIVDSSREHKLGNPYSLVLVLICYVNLSKCINFSVKWGFYIGLI